MSSSNLISTPVKAIDRVGSGASVSGIARVGAAARKMARDFKIAERAAYGLGYGIGWTIRKSAGLAWRALKWGSIAAGGAAMAGGIASAFNLFSVASQFEQYAVTLKTVTGSADAARKSLRWVQSFAQTTPYEVADVMNAFVMLKTRGLDPMDGTLRSLGDAASALGKPLDAAVEMMSDAMTGEFERLKEFGIIARQKGNDVTFSWVQNGKKLSRSVKKDGVAIKAALTDIFDGSYKGGMAAQSRTFAGMISNLKDAWNGFLLKIADAGIFDKVKGSLERLLGRIGELAANGSLDKWATQISAGLEKAWGWATKFVSETNWQEVGGNLKIIGSAVWSIANALGRAVQWSQRFMNIWKYTPTGLIMQGIGAAGNLGGVPTATKPNDGRASGKPTRQTPASAWTKAPPSLLMKQPTGPAVRAPLRQKQSSVDFKGAIDVKVSAAPGTHARVTSLASSDRRVGVRAKTGKTMAAAA